MCAYPSDALSNLSPHEFEFDGIKCASMEGFLQSLKFSDAEMQRFICSLSGITAKRSGAEQDWKSDQTLFWNGISYKRDSFEYQMLLDRAYDALYTNEHFCQALRDTGNAKLVHTVGKSNPADTVLTEREFCSRLDKLRDRLKAEDNIDLI